MGKITHCPEEGECRFDDDFDDDFDDFNWPDYEDVPNDWHTPIHDGCDYLGIPTFDDEEDSDFGLDNYVDDCEDDWYEPIPDDCEDDWYVHRHQFILKQQKNGIQH